MELVLYSPLTVSNPVNAEFLVFRLNLTNTAAEHAYPHLIVMRTLYRAYFIVRQFSNFTTRQVIFERIEIILIVHDTQTATVPTHIRCDSSCSIAYTDIIKQ